MTKRKPLPYTALDLIDGAVMSGANLRGANLTDANMREVVK